jgi:hypothetical protein
VESHRPSLPKVTDSPSVTFAGTECREAGPGPPCDCATKGTPGGVIEVGSSSFLVKWGGVKPAHPDLSRVGGPLANALRIEGTPITTHDDDRRMLGHPGRYTGG